MTRRDWLIQSSRIGLALAATGRPEFASAQLADTWGKHRLTRLSQRPPDYETPVSLLNDFITPVEHFYVRCHMPVPAATDAANWPLRLGGDVTTPAVVQPADLRAMPAATVTMTLECAGNGRAFFSPPVAGIQWRKGAVGTARWTGVRLGDLLRRAGVRGSTGFVHLVGADRPPGTMPPFVRQLPMDKAMHADTLVAYEMNGQSIPPVHGGPLRVIVPGWEGAYSVKWISQLTVAAAESDSFWVATAYRYPVRRVAPGAAVDAKDLVPLTGLVVKSLITTPLDGAAVSPGPVEVGGFAWAGEADVAKVEISIDHGATWRAANLVGERARYTWRRFAFRFMAERPASYLILSRATDSNGDTQPAVAHWNPSGYLWNQYDAIRVDVK